jgi:hypothetical protein
MIHSTKNETIDHKIHDAHPKLASSVNMNTRLLPTLSTLVDLPQREWMCILSVEWKHI